MSDPIDYIDLTIDSPVGKSTKSQNRNIESAPGNTATRRTRKRDSSKRQSAINNDSVIEISVNNRHGHLNVTEVIDVDNIHPTKKTGTCYDNEPTDDNSAVLSCPICYEQLSSNLKPMSTLCGHIFCAQCLQLALRQTKKCPLCKRACKLTSCIRLCI